MSDLGKVCWFDIPVTDFDAAKAFYGALFPWTFTPEQDGYAMITAGEEMIGGFRKRSAPAEKSESPVVYITVESIDAGIATAKEIGAELVGEKIPTGDEGVFQLFFDKDKNLMALWAKS